MSGITPVDIGTCCQCKEPMWMAPTTYETYRRNNQNFYCSHGHPQHFAKGKSEAQKLREELDRERQWRQRAEQRVAEARDDAEHQKRRANGYKGQAARVTKRAKAGVCPCCNRTFQQLAQHMATQHPQFAPEGAEA